MILKCVIGECKTRIALERGERLGHLLPQLRDKSCAQWVTWRAHRPRAKTRAGYEAEDEENDEEEEEEQEEAHLLVTASDEGSPSGARSEFWVCRAAPASGGGAVVGLGYAAPGGPDRCAVAGRGGALELAAVPFDDLHWDAAASRAKWYAGAPMADGSASKLMALVDAHLR